MATKEEDGNDGFLGGLRDLAHLLQEMISQGTCSQEVDDSDHDVGQGGENKLNSDETSVEQGTSKDHQLACLSTTYNALVAYKKSGKVGDSDLAITKYNLPDDEEVTNPIDYTSSDYDVVRYQLQERFSQLSVENDDDSKEFAHDASLKQCMSRTDSSSSDHLEAEQSQYGTHELASGFDVRQPVNQAPPPPKPRLQRQDAMLVSSSICCSHDKDTQVNWILDTQLHALNQPMPTRQSITTTASSPGYTPPISMTKALTTATDFVPKRNPHYYSQSQAPSGQYGNITNAPYLRPNQNESYNMPPSSAAAFQQLGGSNNNTLAPYANMMTSPYWRPEQNDSYNMPPQPAASIDPYAYGSANLFGTSSDNVVGSRFGYVDGVSRNHLPLIQQHQSGDSNMWPPGSRRSRRQLQLQRDFLASLNQQIDRSDNPSDQTQQRLWPRRQLE